MALQSPGDNQLYWLEPNRSVHTNVNSAAKALTSKGIWMTAQRRSFCISHAVPCQVSLPSAPRLEPVRDFAGTTRFEPILGTKLLMSLI